MKSSFSCTLHLLLVALKYVYVTMETFITLLMAAINQVVCLSAVYLPLKQFKSVTLRMSNLVGMERAIWCSVLPYMTYSNHLICGARETNQFILL